jgi:hypothetical protein
MFKYIQSNSWTLFLVLVLSAIFCGSGHAQLSTATMFGSITDSTGAVIPHATVTLTQTDTNFHAPLRRRTMAPIARSSFR